jgi:hypothetical protein
MGKNSIAEYVRMIANNKNSFVSVEVSAVAYPTFTGILPTGEELLNIRLVSEEDDTNFVQLPAIGSNVLVCLIDNQNAIGLVYGELQEVLLRGDQYDGLVKVNDLVTKLNNLENDINNLKTAFSSWVVAPADGGAALKVIAATWYASTLTPTNKTDLENNKVKHG